MITVRTQITVGPQQQALLRNLQPANLARFFERQIPQLRTQIRRNITSAGNIGSSEWPKLSKPYAKRKRLGRTPGAGKFKYSMLRDTGSMYNGITGRVVRSSLSNLRLELHAEGQQPGRPSNDELLSIHHFGKGRVPARNVALSMRVFEQRVQNALAKFLGGTSASGAAG